MHVGRSSIYVCKYSEYVHEGVNECVWVCVGIGSIYECVCIVVSEGR